MKWPLLFLLISNAYAVECSMQNMLKENSALMPANQELIEPVRGQGGFINPFYEQPRPSSDEGLEFPSVRRARVLATVKPRPREEAEQLIREVKELLKREISGTGIQSPHQNLMLKRIEDINVSITDCPGPEGTNNSTTYRIELCQNTLKMPKLALVALIAHEIGHSLDLCGLSSKRYKNTSAENSFLLDTTFTRTDEDTRAFQQRVETSLELVDPGIPQNENPLASTYQCLNQVDPYYKPLKDNHRDTCLDRSFGEDGAQIWGARITARFVDIHRPDKIEAIGLFANSMTGISKDGIVSDKGNKEHDIDAMFFSEPAIRSMFGCTQSPSQNCMTNFRPSEARSLREMIQDVSELGTNPVQVSCGLSNP